VAGGGRARPFWERCAAECLSRGVEVEVFETRRRGDAAERAAEAGDRLVVSVGGDGTAHEVVNGLLSSRPPHQPSPQEGGRGPKFGALLRGGTAGDLARSVPSPSRPEDVPAWLTSDHWRSIDAVRLETSAGRRFFINAADAGIGAEVVRRAARGPAWAGGTANFLGGALVSLLTHRNATVRVRLDGGPPVERRIRTIAISNGAYLGGGMRMAPAAQIDDGILEIVTIADIGRLKGIVSLPLLYRGTHGRLREVEFARARRVEIDADKPVGVEADGELVGTTPAVFEIAPAALEVIDWQPSGILSSDRTRVSD
jgi:diacylglycerol kinase (ATP)